MRDFEVTIRLRNNHLKRRRLELGMTIPVFAASVGMNHQSYSALETMHDSPLTKDGQWRPVAQRISDFHGVPCEKLWPQVVLAVKKTVATREISGAELRLLAEQPLDPERLLMEKEAQQDELLIADLVAGAHRRHRRQMQAVVLRSEGKTLKEVGELLGVTPARARDIEIVGCRRIRRRVRNHPELRERVEAKIGRDIDDKSLREYPWMD